MCVCESALASSIPEQRVVVVVDGAGEISFGSGRIELAELQARIVLFWRAGWEEI